jgi:hypothetical protein
MSPSWKALPTKIGSPSESIPPRTIRSGNGPAALQCIQATPLECYRTIKVNVKKIVIKRMHISIQFRLIKC